jgi:hypothetical protein
MNVKSKDYNDVYVNWYHRIFDAVVDMLHKPTNKSPVCQQTLLAM